MEHTAWAAVMEPTVDRLMAGTTEEDDWSSSDHRLEVPLFAPLDAMGDFLAKKQRGMTY